jgi:DNA-binding transcriptional MerR regulator
MPGQLRIGELSRRSGVSTELLRAWERRYGLLRPTRSKGGYRLYAADDERRVAAMRSHLDRGLSAAEAAHLALDEADDEAAVADTPALARGVDQLRAALDELDEAGAQAALDRMLAELTVETVLRDAVLPYLRELGERWERGDASIGQEHFASGVLRGRLLGLARGWGRGAGPRAVLACAPGEQHEFGLIAFGLGLRQNGWRITYLGPDTPLDTLAEIADALQPDAVVIAATTAARLEQERPALAALATSRPLWLAGPAALDELSEAVGATVIDAEPLAAAEGLSRPAAA